MQYLWYTILSRHDKIIFSSVNVYGNIVMYNLVSVTVKFYSVVYQVLLVLTFADNTIKARTDVNYHNYNSILLIIKVRVIIAYIWIS